MWYIEDIFFSGDHREDKFKNFMDDLNKTHAIKFTFEWSNSTINILNVAVSIKNGLIETDLYVESSENRSYLFSSSGHQFHDKMGIAYSQALRLIEFILEIIILIKIVSSFF